MIWYLLIAVLAAAVAAPTPRGTPEEDFAFLLGEWNVKHRYLRVRGETREWVEADGTCSHRDFLDGRANLDEYVTHGSGGVHHGVALRSWDPRSAQWSIWWLDGRYPALPLDPPMRGSFANGVGTFYGEQTVGGKPTRTRFLWTRDGPDAARWEQAYASGAAGTWETNWIMEFRRARDGRVPLPARPAGARDFDFLRGDWEIHNRKLFPDSRQWVEFEGTASHRDLMDGAANMEEYVLNSPRGAYRALSLRSYDPQDGLWSIRWLDGRYPSRPLDPPVKGRFENGVGTFYADYTQDGKPMRGRFLWSQITGTSARWEQASSADGGTTWEPNWIIEFRRARAKTSKPPA